MAGRSKRKAPAEAAPARKASKGRGSLLLALLSGLLVMLGATLYLGSGKDSLARMPASSIPALAVGLAILLAFTVYTWSAKHPGRGQVAGALVGIVTAAVLVNSGGAPDLGRAMTKLGAMMPPNASSCATGQGKRPSDGQCVRVPKCPAGKELAWQRNTKPVCVKEAA